MGTAKQAILVEAADKRDAGHFQWTYYVLDHNLVCFQTSGGSTVEWQALALRLEESRFGYLSVKDRLPVRDAVLTTFPSPPFPYQHDD